MDKYGYRTTGGRIDREGKGSQRIPRYRKTSQQKTSVAYSASAAFWSLEALSQCNCLCSLVRQGLKYSARPMVLWTYLG